MDEPLIDLPDYVTRSTEYQFEELERALRNREMPLEALRFDVTPAGLHYLLVHFDIPAVDPHAYRLAIRGAVERPLEFDLEGLRALPSRSITVTMECAGNGRGLLHPRPLGQPWLSGAVSTATWTGASLVEVLERAQPLDEAVEVAFEGSDRGFDGDGEVAFERSLSLAEALDPDVLLAWAMNGQPLPVQHGAPLRLIVPGWYGMASVKWLRGIRILTAPFEGPFQSQAYRIFQPQRDDAPPVTRMLPRALLTPPGLPNVETGGRTVNAGPVTVSGRAWSGFAPIATVEVRVDDGAWSPAVLEPPVDHHAWREFRFEWQARTGTWQLVVRAMDEAGNVQPLESPWNLHGYANNAVRPVLVTVR